MRVAAAMVIATITSCTIYGESSTPSDEATPTTTTDGGDASDGGNIDWGSSSSGGTKTDSGDGDGGKDGDTMLVPALPPNGDFEIPACDGWSGGGNATLADETMAVHGGSHACKVCGLGTIWQISRKASYTATPGDTLRSTAWVRAETGTVPITIGITVASNDQHTDIMTIGTTYTFVQSPAILVNAPGNVEFQLEVTSGGSACFIVDDATVAIIAGI